MALPSTGSLSASEINTEFFDSYPVALSEYRGKTVYKPGGNPIGNDIYTLPSSQISYSDFRGVYSTYYIDVLVVGAGGGGGSGGGNGGGGGGGGGAHRTATSLLVVNGLSYRMTIASGGAGSGNNSLRASDAETSLFYYTYGNEIWADNVDTKPICSGGRGGGSSAGERNGSSWGIVNQFNYKSAAGGSGGGSSGAGGATGGNYNGGAASFNDTVRGSGGGGGGRGAAGNGASNSTGGTGGSGADISAFTGGTSDAYDVGTDKTLILNWKNIGGGGGGGSSNNAARSAGGVGGGGSGGGTSSGGGDGGVPHSGGGGGGSTNSNSGGTGGSGLVIVKYVNTGSTGSPIYRGSGGTPTRKTVSGVDYCFHIFTATGDSYFSA